MEALVVRQDGAAEVEYVSHYPDPEPGLDEVAVDVRLAGICATDLEIVRGYMNFSGVPGHEFVGVVADGPRHLLGRRVVGEINCVCGSCDLCSRGLSRHCRRRTVLGIAGRDGAFAQRVVLPEVNCHLVPDEVSDEIAVFTEPVAAAVEVLRLHPIDQWMDVVVLGSGRLGLVTAQVLATRDCRLQVIGRNPQTLRFCERLGIQPVHVNDVVPKAVHDVVVDCTGSPDGLRLAMQLCRPRGTIVLKSTYAEPPEIDLAPVVINELNVIGNRCGPFPEALELLRTGRVHVEDMVSRTFPLRRGRDAFAAAARPDHLKVLLRPGAGA